MKFECSRALVLVAMFSFISIASLSWCLYRDIQIEKMYPGDLRNRVVGSRMQMDGLSPYFYHYQLNPNSRYYDWNNSSQTYTISNVTATPFFHQLISPIANFSQRSISKIWLVSEYAALMFMTLAAIKFARTREQRIAVLLTSLLFLYSNAWTNHVNVGQLYLFIAAEAMLYYYLLTRPQKPINAALAGIVAAAVILTRPTAIVFVAAFLLVANRFSRRYLFFMSAGFLTTIALAFATSNSRFFWDDYRKAMAIQLDHHRAVNHDPQNYPELVDLEQLEGWHKPTFYKASEWLGYHHNDANGNVFVFIDTLSGSQSPIWLLGALCVITILSIYFVFIRVNKMPWHANIFSSSRPGMDLYAASMLGFICYMMTDLFSPIHRFHYNATQWIFPLLLVASHFKPSTDKLFSLIAITGLLFNSITRVYIPMQQTLGEYLVAFAIVGFLITYKPARVV